VLGLRQQPHSKGVGRRSAADRGDQRRGGRRRQRHHRLRPGVSGAPDRPGAGSATGSVSPSSCSPSGISAPHAPEPTSRLRLSWEPSSR
jgi:hypothetical protein